MELGTCTRCGAPYTAADVIGLGILRARSAAQGGPRVEYRCPRCGRIEVLVPHGEGRYAPPGAPPPAVSPPPEARRPAWVGEASPPPPPMPPEREAPAPKSAPAAAPPPPPSTSAGPLRADEALALLGVSPTASREEIERAFRSKSLACHPDKVAHLDPDLQQLAEQKFKRLIEAYRLLLG